ncbi:MAG: SRPBCC family protein [Bacteroidales bacterium]|nr:SRPBCC family protein [Bacteroidales bacterium]
MTIIEKKLSINAPKEMVWDVIADLGGIQNYNPTVKKSFYNTDIKSGEGAGRICEFNPMGKVDEKATQWDEGNNYTLHIRPLEKLPFFKEGFAHFSLSSTSNGETEVSVEFEYDVTGGPVAWVMNKVMLRNNFDKGFEGILKGLKKHIEDGVVIENASSLKGYQVSFA